MYPTLIHPLKPEHDFPTLYYYFFSEYKFIMKTFDKNTIRTMTQDDLTPTPSLSDAIGLIKWTLVDAIEMNPETKDEIQEAWTTILERVQ